MYKWQYNHRLLFKLRHCIAPTIHCTTSMSPPNNSFKQKTNKKIVLNEKSIVTLDSKHRENQSMIAKLKSETIPKLVKEKRALQQQLIFNPNIPNAVDMRERIQELRTAICEHQQKCKNYYLDNNEIIFDYFENKQQICNGNNKTKILNDFFRVESVASKEDQLKRINQSNVQRYLTNLDPSYIDISKYVCQTDVCRYCHSGEMIPVENEGIMVCNNCSIHVSYLVENEKPSYKEPPNEACFYAYKRINHFKEILAQFQAKETTQIPPDVLENIKHQIKKERIDLHTQLTDKKAKEILKKLGYNKYYEHIPFIKEKLGIKPPVMSPELEETLCNLFMEIQGPYAKFCPEDRVNFLNYYYTVYKLCELLDQREFLPYFPMLKDREKRIEQDEIWKKICEELNWEFIATI